MSNFEFYTPTHVYFGRDTQRQVGNKVINKTDSF